MIGDEPASAVAAKFKLKENAVYQIKNRLMRRLRIDVERRLRWSGAETTAPSPSERKRTPRARA